MRNFLACLIFAAVLGLTATVQAQTSFTKGAIEIQAPWSRATPGGAGVGAGYLAITNKGTQPDRLLSFTTNLSAQPEVHEMATEGGIMKMRPLPKGLEIPAGATVKLEPGGYHLMLLKLKKPLVQGQRYKATLVFEKAGSIEVEFEVRAIGANEKASPHKHH